MNIEDRIELKKELSEKYIDELEENLIITDQWYKTSQRLNNIIKEFEEELEKERKIDRPRDDYNYGVSNTLDYMWYELQKIKGSDEISK